MPLLQDYLGDDFDPAYLDGDDELGQFPIPRMRMPPRRPPPRPPGRRAAPGRRLPPGWGGGAAWPTPPLPGGMLSPVQHQAAQQLYSPMGGVPLPGPRVEPLGFPVFTFNNTSGTVLVQIARPQKPFKGSRLVISTARTGATATGLVSVADLSIGARPVLVNRAQPIPADTFAPTAFGIELLMDTATPGIDITLQLTISAAPGAGDSVVVGASILGMTWS